jgi:hypothetical protein
LNRNPTYSSNGVFPNLLLITGSGRERGKTLLACNIINEWKKSYDIVAIKISAHCHEDPRSTDLIYSSGTYSIWQEKEISSKDSGRFIEAGAVKVFYVEARDQELPEAFRVIYGLCSEKSLIICESGGLGRYIKPGVMLFVQHVNDIVGIGKRALLCLSDRIIYSGSPEMSDPSLIINITDHHWILVTAYQDATHSTTKDPPDDSDFENRTDENHESLSQP